MLGRKTNPARFLTAPLAGVVLLLSTVVGLLVLIGSEVRAA